MAKQFTGFRLPPNLKDQLFEICKAKGVFVTSEVTRLIDRYVTEQLTDEGLKKRIHDMREMEAKAAAYEAARANQNNASAWHVH